MKTKTINLYTLEELSEDSREKAFSKWKEDDDYHFLSDDLNEKLHELLQEYGIKDTNDTSKPGTKPTEVQYSLSSCQGDGVMFEGKYIYTYNFASYLIEIEHSGHYYHSYSKSYATSLEGEEVDNWHEVEKAFDVIYQKICKELERYGYDYIENEDSMESFTGSCEANEYTFEANGVMNNT